MQSTLTDLIPQMRQILPKSKDPTELKLNMETGVVTLAWMGRRFLVRKYFEVFELRDRTIFITSASQRMQAALKQQGKNKKVFHCHGQLQQAEALLGHFKQRVVH